MSVAIIIPADPAGDEHREQALAYVVDRLSGQYPDAALVVSGSSADGPWSKGRAVKNGLAELAGVPEVLVIHDGDSFLRDRAQLDRAIEHIEKHPLDWCIPHKMVYRLKEIETARCIANPDRHPRKMVVRTPYVGTAGGGITVLSPHTFAKVGGIDERFEGWGGEDVALGWALETLVGPAERFEGQLFHLWHDHPAPDLRGSPASEELVEQYRGARGYRRRMEELVELGEWEPLPALAEPVRFRMTANRKTLRIAGHEPIRFSQQIYDSSDPDEVEALKRHPHVVEIRGRR